MIRKLMLLIVILFIAVSTGGCSLFNDNSVEQDYNKEIYSHPKTLNLDRGKLSAVPEYSEYSIDAFQVDLRGYNLIDLDLQDKFNQLIHSDFDTTTKWPYNLPKGFDPKKVMEYGKNPGLGIKNLNKKSINGSGVGAAIIGGPILVEHIEYKKQLKLYKELNFTSRNASPEGTAAASVLAGNSTGVSPGVDLYYVAVEPSMGGETSSAHDGNKFDERNQKLAYAINWITDFNKKLPQGSKIRVLCIQEKITKDDKYFSNIMNSLKKANASGIFVISDITNKLYSEEMNFIGLGRDALSYPDILSSYLPAKSWANKFYSLNRYMPSSNTLFVPSDSRCVASPTGNKDYAFYSVSNCNLSLPYTAGLYALACQVNPSITPGEFIKKAVETSDLLEIVNKNINYKYRIKNVVNPVKLLHEISR